MSTHRLTTAAAAGSLVMAAAFAAGAQQQQQDEQLAEIDKPASRLEQILAHEAEMEGGTKEVRVVEVTIDPRTAAGWHTHPTPVFVYVKEGEITMEVEGQEPRQISAGTAVAEPLESPMRVVNRGDDPAEMVVFQISPKQQAFLKEGKGQDAAAQPKQPAEGQR